MQQDDSYASVWDIIHADKMLIMLCGGITEHACDTCEGDRRMRADMLNLPELVTNTKLLSCSSSAGKSITAVSNSNMHSDSELQHMYWRTNLTARMH